MRALPWLFLAATSLVQAQLTDWPVAVGGNSSRYGRSANAGPTAKNLLWSGGLAAQVAQQGMAEGNGFYCARMFNISDTLQGTLLMRFDLNTGQEIWRKSLPVDFPATDWRNKMSAVRNGVVYATRAGNTNSSYLYALDAATGNTIWRSADRIDETSTESISFTTTGDIVAGSSANVKRIRASDGTTVWTANRSSPSSDGSSVAVFGNHGFTWEATANGPRVDVIDMDTGAILYRGAAIGGGFVQQLGLFVGPDGTVYAPRSQNNVVTDFLVAYADTGSALTEKWRVPIGYCPFASHAVGPDGSVYAYSQSSPPGVMRLNAATGATLNVSPPIPSDFFQPRMAIDSNGLVYLTNGAFSNGTLISYNPDLTVRWSESIPNVNIGGPVIGQNGTLVVCGTSTIRAYRDPQDTFAQSYSIFRGIFVSGDVTSLSTSDDNALVVKNGLVANANEPTIAIDVTSTSPLSAPGTFQFKYEGHASTAGLTQEIALFDWSQNAFVILDSRPAPLVDTVVTVTSATPSSFIQAGTLAIKSRVQYRKTGPTASANYSASLDRTAWTIRP